MNAKDLMGMLGSVGAEFMAKLSMISDGYNVAAPSQYIVDNEQRWMPKEDTRDVFYEVMPTIAELPMSKRVSVLRGLVFSLLTPIEMMDFSDGFALESVRFLTFLKEHPEFKQKFESEEEKKKFFDKFAEKQAQKQAAKFERDREIKELGKKFTEQDNNGDED